MIFEKERERFSVLHTGYQMIFEKERERFSVLYIGYQVMFEKERERETFGFVYWLPGDV
jgi:hypothetical protein